MAILVLFNYAALMLSVSLNAVFIINLLMAIGFTVDYSAHIAHEYVVSNKLSENERVVDALNTLGASVILKL